MSAMTFDSIEDYYFWTWIAEYPDARVNAQRNLFVRLRSYFNKRRK